MFHDSFRRFGDVLSAHAEERRRKLYPEHFIIVAIVAASFVGAGAALL
ncbi:MAG: hypothetical protein ACTHKM_00225 [Tsuneonella sp.]